MNVHAQKFLETYGEHETRRVCEAAGTSLVYFKQVCDGRRNFSRKLAEKLQEASDGRLDKVALVFGPPKTPPPMRRAA
jgi:hypothetical protein